MRARRIFLYRGNIGTDLFRSLPVARLLFKCLQPLNFGGLSLFTFTPLAFLLLPMPTLPFEMFFPSFSVDCFGLELDHELI